MQSSKQKCDNCGKPLAEDSAPGVNVCAECTAPDWSGKCEACGQSPILPLTGLCGPCTFGEADTAGGNW